ncbi:MAG: NAD(+) synthase [Deltaproteobacteria bacterium RIFOXYA12_FULL_61_11]|nr:MAG: NAD(+) synthase [Deltaproteobacteria bacterium RIFOXYA12_FULL_61_11]
MDCGSVTHHLVTWLCRQVREAGQHGLVIGVSGGIDSAVCSTLCGHTGLPVTALSLPIHQAPGQLALASEHLTFLDTTFVNVTPRTLDLTLTFDRLTEDLPEDFRTPLALANARSRLRMTALYAAANASSALVCGTGNKIEDFGVGFFTKYGDGGVDLSPIGDLVKSEVYELGAFLGVSEGIRRAAPTDGLWEGSPSDEEQIGASYAELEWALTLQNSHPGLTLQGLQEIPGLSSRQCEVAQLYLRRHLASAHKLRMPPICSLKGVK